MGEQIRYSSDRPAMVWLGETLVPERLTLTSDDDDGAPYVTAVFEVRGGRPELVSLTVTARPEGQGRGIRLRDLERVLSFDGTAVRVFERFAVQPDDTGGGPAGGRDERDRWAARDDIHRARTARRRPVDRAELERVAAVYAEHAGHRNPIQTVARALGYSYRTAARRIQRARDEGLLPASPRRGGRA